jgi:hypothetical protein
MNRILMEDGRRKAPVNPLDRPTEKPKENAGPRRPETDTTKENLLKRMKRVDPKQAERYRQRTGE